jgi:hypothetical protein
MSVNESARELLSGPTTRRRIVATGAKVAYAAPVIAATMHLSAQYGAAAVSGPNPTHYCSGQMAFGPNGWGGWSCPSGSKAVGGEAISEGKAIAVEKIAQPGESYPHYTFGPNEWGYVVQNGPDAQSIDVCVDCVPLDV